MFDHEVMEVSKLSVHLLLVLNRILNHFNSLLLLSGDVVSDLIALLILLSFLVGHVNLEPLDGRGDSKPHSVLLLLQLLINCKEDNLVWLLRLENVHDLETLLVVLCLGLVVVHWELRIVLLIGLNNLSNEESTSHSEEELLADPHEDNEAKDEDIGKGASLKSCHHLVVKVWSCDLSCSILVHLD